ncbi:DUF4232 domain-containing protein [Saccharothrix longispora]|uniref:DUF4232 domain-containing protein n=1 Tax=Saccharothrix longispora TaxID=33920 RepID=UPI0028FD5762|nr:DUF4232 domain-containing protein [Saccharothrix longispora]MDU0290540.1 DUF4232 domain-containing protein [Saccharothrix longispora]
MPRIIFAALLVLLTSCTTPPPEIPAPRTPTTPSVDRPAPPPAIPSPAIPSSGTSSSGAPCTAGLLRYSLGERDAAMGLRTLGIRATNCGTQPLTLDGYPAIEVLDDTGAVLPVVVGRGSFGISSVESFDAMPQPVTIHPGEYATTAVLWRNTYDDTTAPPAVGTQLRITAASDIAAEVFALADEEGPNSIDLGSTGRLGVAPWRAVTPG